MNNDALVAALGVDAVAAVHGYRLEVISEAERRGLRLVNDPLSDVAQAPAEAGDVDPIDIRLTFLHCPGRPELAGRMLSWEPAHGWSLSHRTANAPLSYYADRGATPLHLVPTASQVVEWATGECDGPATPLVGIELDDDPGAIRRLLGFIPQRDLKATPAFQLAARARSDGVHPQTQRSSAASRASDPFVTDGSRDVGAGIGRARKSG